MAITGLLLFGFVIAHLAGNLLVFLGQDTYNSYAMGLKELPILWPARVTLFVLAALHIGIALKLRRANKQARPVRYSCRTTIQATAASLYMVETGVAVLIFIVVHLMHFTLNTVDPSFARLIDSKGRHDAYSMIVHGFQNPWYVTGYIIAMSTLGFHLSHGISSAFHTLGFYGPDFTSRLRRVAAAVALLIALGYISIPVAVQLGFIGLRGRGLAI